MCLPLLTVLLFFGIETGRLLVDFQTVSKSLRDSARYLGQVEITCPGSTPSSGPLVNYIDTTITPTVKTIAQNLALTGTPDTPVPGNLLLPYWDGSPGDLTMTVSCVANGGAFQGIFNGAALIPRVTVAAAVPFSFIWGTSFAATNGLTINISHSQVSIGG